MTKLTDLMARLKEDAEFREEYARIDGQYALIEVLVRARSTAKLTQTELASRLGTTRSAVARLEGGRVSPSLATYRPAGRVSSVACGGHRSGVDHGSHHRGDVQ